MKGMAAALSAVYLFTVVGAPLAEAGFWKERRTAAAGREAKPGPVQYARLPAAREAALLPALTRFPAVPVESRPSAAVPAESFTAAATLPRAVATLPAAYGTIRRLAPAGKQGRPWIVLVEDVHDVFPAQQSIVRILESVAPAGSSAVIGLEGAAGDFDLRRFRSLSLPDVRREVSGALLRLGLINGPDHFALTAASSPRLWGLEDPALYEENVRAYRDGLALKKEALERSEALAASLRALRAQALTSDQAEYDRLRDSFAAGNLGPAAYVKALSRWRRPSPAGYPHLSRWLAALETEETLNFDRVEKERLAVIEALAPRLNGASLEQLLQRSLDYRLGHIGYGEFYFSLRRFAEQNGVRLADYPHFRRYVDYALLAEGIDRSRLFDELEAWAEDVQSALRPNRRQREVLAASDDWRLLDKLWTHRLSPREWARYNERPIDTLPERIGTPVSGFGVLRAPFERFYAAAERRNGALVSGLLKKISADGGSSVGAAVVLGGFHTDRVEALLSARGYPTVTVTPKLDGPVSGSGTEYLSVFAGGRTPVEKLLLGDRLYLNPPSPLSQLPPSLAHLRDALDRSFASFYMGLGALQDPARTEALQREVEAAFGVPARLKTVGTATSDFARYRVRLEGSPAFDLLLARKSSPAEHRLARAKTNLSAAELVETESSEYRLAMVPARSGLSGRLDALRDRASGLKARARETLAEKISDARRAAPAAPFFAAASAGAVSGLLIVAGQPLAALAAIPVAVGALGAGLLTGRTPAWGSIVKGLTAGLSFGLFAALVFGLNAGGVDTPALGMVFGGVVGMGGFRPDAASVAYDAEDETIRAALAGLLESADADSLKSAEEILVRLQAYDGARAARIFDSLPEVQRKKWAAELPARVLGILLSGLWEHRRQHHLAGLAEGDNAAAQLAAALEARSETFSEEDAPTKGEPEVKEPWGPEWLKDRALLREALPAERFDAAESVFRSDRLIASMIRKGYVDDLSRRAFEKPWNRRGLKFLNELISDALDLFASDERRKAAAWISEIPLHEEASLALAEDMRAHSSLYGRRLLAVNGARGLPGTATASRLLLKHAMVTDNVVAALPLSEMIDSSRGQSGLHKPIQDVLTFWRSMPNPPPLLGHVSRRDHRRLRLAGRSSSGSAPSGAPLNLYVDLFRENNIRIFEGDMLRLVGIMAAEASEDAGVEIPFATVDSLHRVMLSVDASRREDALGFIAHALKEAADAAAASGRRSVDPRDVLPTISRLLNASAGSRKETPAVDEFSSDLTAQALQGLLDPVVGRTTEIDRMVSILTRRRKNNPLLIGEPGVGKTALAEGLAARITEGRVPKKLLNKRVVVLDMAGMMAGTTNRGEFEERLKAVIQELEDSDGQIIAFIDEIHSIVGMGDSKNGLDAANILKPALARGTIRLIGATTLDEYQKYIEKDKALERRFQPVRVEEPTPDEALAILEGLKKLYEDHHGVIYPAETLKAAVDLGLRYLPYRQFPDKAIDLIDEAGAAKSLAMAADPAANPAVSVDDIAQVVSRWSGVPVRRMTEGEAEKLRRLEDELGLRVISQEDAVREVALAVQKNRIGLNNPKRPLGSFIFEGPTGVGKTELARALAEYLFGSEDALVRLDMSEYMEKHQVARLVGSPPGYVGHDDGGQLTEAVRRKPYSIVLLDEIEKAHPDVFSILLQVMEDGRLTDSQGRTVDFKNTILIMTTNAGTGWKAAVPIGFGREASEPSAKVKALEALKQVFELKFLNRVDAVVSFHRLGVEDIRRILEKELAKLSKRMARKGFDLPASNVSPAAKEFLIANTNYKDFGARDLRKVLRRRLLAELSREAKVLQAKFSSEKETVYVEYDPSGDKLVFGFGERPALAAAPSSPSASSQGPPANEPSFSRFGLGLTERQHRAVNEAIHDFMTNPALKERVRRIAPNERAMNDFDPGGVFSVNGVQIFLIEGLKDRIREAAEIYDTASPESLVSHPGRTRMSLYIDADEAENILKMDKEWRRAWARHEWAHMDHPDWSESEIHQAFPVPALLNAETENLLADWMTLWKEFLDAKFNLYLGVEKLEKDAAAGGIARNEIETALSAFRALGNHVAGLYADLRRGLDEIQQTFFYMLGEIPEFEPAVGGRLETFQSAVEEALRAFFRQYPHARKYALDFPALQLAVDGYPNLRQRWTDFFPEAPAPSDKQLFSSSFPEMFGENMTREQTLGAQAELLAYYRSIPAEDLGKIRTSTEGLLRAYPEMGYGGVLGGDGLQIVTVQDELWPGGPDSRFTTYFMPVQGSERRPVPALFVRYSFMRTMVELRDLDITGAWLGYAAGQAHKFNQPQWDELVAKVREAIPKVQRKFPSLSYVGPRAVAAESGVPVETVSLILERLALEGQLQRIYEPVCAHCEKGQPGFFHRLSDLLRSAGTAEACAYCDRVVRIPSPLDAQDARRLRSSYRFPPSPEEKKPGTALAKPGVTKIKIESPKKKFESPALDKYGRNLTRLAEEGGLDAVVGRQDELHRLMIILSRRKKNNPVLLGPAGVGKTAIVEGLAQKIARGEVPPQLRGKQIYSLDLGLLLSGTRNRGMFEERMKAVVDAVEASKGEVILFIDELHTVIGAGRASGASQDAADILKPALARGQVRTIGATTLDEYRRTVEKDKALERRFQPIMVDPPNEEATLKILEGVAPLYEEHHAVSLPRAVLEAAVSLAARYLPNRQFPDKAIDLIDEAGSLAHRRLESASEELSEMKARIELLEGEIRRLPENDAVRLAKAEERESLLNAYYDLADEQARKILLPVSATVDDVASVVARWTGIPVERLSADEVERLRMMEDFLRRRVIAQDPALEAVSDVVRVALAELDDPDRPDGSFIFLGPSGVGKTELARALAEFLFGSEDALIRIDMSEYGEKHTVARLIGAPPGYIGYDEGGQLTEAVRRKPYSVILLEEIEEAHPDVFNILLQILEDGRLTDGQGRTVDFKNTIVIMTSNIGTGWRNSRRVGFNAGEETEEASVPEELKKIFRPEFLNRIDEIVPFGKLEPDDIRLVLAKELVLLAEQWEPSGFVMPPENVSVAAREFLIERSDPKQFGARELRRAIKNHVKDPLTEKLLESGTFSDGVEIHVDYRPGDEGLTFDIRPAPPSEQTVRGGTWFANSLYAVRLAWSVELPLSLLAGLGLAALTGNPALGAAATGGVFWGLHLLDDGWFGARRTLFGSWRAAFSPAVLLLAGGTFLFAAFYFTFGLWHAATIASGLAVQLWHRRHNLKLAGADLGGLIPPSIRQSLGVDDLWKVRHAAEIERFDRNVSFLAAMSLFERDGGVRLDSSEDGFVPVTADAADFAEMLNAVSFKFAAPQDLARLRALLNAFASESVRLEDLAGSDSAASRTEYAASAARLGLTFGAASRVSPRWGTAAKDWILRDLLALRSRLSGEPADARHKEAAETLFRLGAELPDDDAEPLRTPAVQLADVFGEDAGNVPFLEKIAERAGQSVVDEAGREWRTLTLLATDKDPATLRRSVEKALASRRAEGASTANLEGLLKAWNEGAVAVQSKADLSRRNALRDDGRIDVARLLSAPEFGVSKRHAIRIVTRDANRWWTDGLPEDRRALVEFLLWVTQDVFFRATKTDLDQYLRAVQVLNIQA